MTKRLLSVGDIAVIFGVKPQTVTSWRYRYEDFPEPDVVIGETSGWDRSRIKEIRMWERRRPGKGNVRA